MSGNRDTRAFWPRRKEGIQKRMKKTPWRLDREHVLSMHACKPCFNATFDIGGVASTLANAHTHARIVLLILMLQISSIFPLLAIPLYVIADLLQPHSLWLAGTPSSQLNTI